MHSNRLWIFFLIIIGAVTFYFTLRGGSDLYHYYSLKEKTDLYQIHFEVESQKNGKYRAVASYQFLVSDQSYKKSKEQLPKLFRNSWSAHQWTKEINNKQLKVWYQKNNPNHSSLSKIFPLKSLLSASVMLLLMVYFIGIGYYISQASKKE